jgi:hypothetical protein
MVARETLAVDVRVEPGDPGDAVAVVRVERLDRAEVPR